MTDIVVRYEPESGWWRVHRDGYPRARHAEFKHARRHAKHLNGGTLPRVRSYEYGVMFPDRLAVYGGLGCWVIAQGVHELVFRWTTHAAAMTAAHELATETTGGKR